MHRNRDRATNARVPGGAGRVWPAGTVGLLAAAAWLLAPGAGVAAAQAPGTASFTSPGRYEFTVPAGVTSVTITAVGGAGGSCGTSPGGRGASVTGTFPATPGQQLDVAVAGAGSSCGVAPGNAPGGGGAGGSGGNLGLDAAGGGGTSEVSLASGATSVPLLIAGGGGGTGAPVGLPGGDAGSAGQGTGSNLGGGQPGTATAGGAGGTGEGTRTAAGAAGSLGLGGAGGSYPAGAAGGGGGGGYYGGGGGGGGLGGRGAGGGGGSSFLAADATATSAPTPTSTPPSVTIAYPVASATLSTQSLAFPGPQPQGTVSAALLLGVTNTGSAALNVSGVQTTGANPSDYLISNGCSQPVAPGSSCQIAVRFAPQGLGARAASLTVLTNSSSPLAAVSLSGTGATTTAVTQPASASQAGGAASQRKPAGHVICHKAIRGAVQCELEFAPGSAIQGKRVQATFKVLRGSRVVAHGTLTLERGVTSRRQLRLAPGSYTVIIATVSGRRAKMLLRLAFRVH